MVNKNKKKNISTIIILAIVLLVPGFLYVALHKVGSNEYVRLPIYGEKVLSGKMNRKMGREIADTTYHTVQPIQLLDSMGNLVPVFDQDSLITVVHLFYAKDSGLSKTLLSNFRTVSDRFAYNNKIRFYSLSIDSLDGVEEIKNTYSTYVPSSNRNWQVLGSNSSFLDYVRTNLLIDAFQSPADSNKYVFGNNFILLDSENRIRGFYDINLKTDIDRLEDEIKVQMVEEIRNNPLKIQKK